MKLFLQASSGQPTIALWDGGLVFEQEFAPFARPDYAKSLKAALAQAGLEMTALDGIIIDIGPGRLGATRSAVAFANGLGFALGIPLIGLNSFVLLGSYVEALHHTPCLVLRKAARNQYHWALVKSAKIFEAGFADQDEIRLAYRGPLCVAGDAAKSLALPDHPDATWHDLAFAPARVLQYLDIEARQTRHSVVPLIDSAGL